MDTLFTDWSDDKALRWGRDTVVAHHTLHNRELFSDEGLADLLDRYPRDLIGVYTMGRDPASDRVFRSGHAGTVPGRELLETVKAGRLWLNLRLANHHLPEYAALEDEIFGGVEARVRGLKTRKRDIGVLISSPNAQVFYHLDIPLVMLWQVRGEKAFRVYPTGSPFAENADIEAIVLRETEEEIAYMRAFEASAELVNLTPGMMASWPQNAPHRIVNGNMLNVSLSCEYQTLSSVARANALYTNGILRRRFGLSPEIENHGMLRLWLKAGLARAIKLFNSRTGAAENIRPSFVVDPDAVDGVRDLAPA